MALFIFFQYEVGTGGGVGRCFFILLSYWKCKEGQKWPKMTLRQAINRKFPENWSVSGQWFFDTFSSVNIWKHVHCFECELEMSVYSRYAHTLRVIESFPELVSTFETGLFSFLLKRWKFNQGWFVLSQLAGWRGTWNKSQPFLTDRDISHISSPASDLITLVYWLRNLDWVGLIRCSDNFIVSSLKDKNPIQT